MATLCPSFITKVTCTTGNSIIMQSNVQNMEEINNWVKEYGEATYTHWNSRSSRQNAKTYICWKKFVCHHSSFMKVTPENNKQSICKNSKCPATIELKVEIVNKFPKATDSFIQEGLPCHIIIDNCHNHSLNTAEALRFLPAADHCKSSFFEYFDSGMGIAESCRYHVEVLQLQEGFNEMQLANNQINPTYRAVQHWYEQWRVLNMGPRSGIGMLEKLKEKIGVYANQGILVAYKEKPFAAVLITPIMKRAHELNSAGQMIFVDTTSSCDPENHSITFLLTPCAAGAVPVAIVVTQGQTEEAYMQGFSLLKEGMKEDAFNKKGAPDVFLTDHAAAEINALKKTWPRSKNLLCIFHIAQAVWRWLFDGKNNIPKENRRPLMLLFQAILYAKDAQAAEEAFLNTQGYIGTYLPTYPLWNQYVENYWKIKEMWCLAFRNEIVRGHHTNNFSEVCVRIFKDHILSRVKAYNVLTLIDFSAIILEDYYKRRLVEFSNSRNAGPRLLVEKLKQNFLSSGIAEDDVERLATYEFEVRGKNTTYLVNVKSGCCSCHDGMYGKFCKHQFAAYHYHNVWGANFPPISPNNKHQIAYLALGNKTPPLDFYMPFLKADIVPPLEDMEVDNDPSLQIMPIIQLDTSVALVEDDENDDRLRENLIKEFGDALRKFKSSAPAMKKALLRLKSMRSEGQCETMLNTLGANIPRRRKAGSAIRVQPTSIARRSAPSRGTKRLASGRPAKRRNHNLAENIKLDRPNAKKH